MNTIKETIFSLNNKINMNEVILNLNEIDK